MSPGSQDRQKPQPTHFSVWPSVSHGEVTVLENKPTGPLTQSPFLLPPAHPHSWGAQAPTTQTHSPDSLTCRLWLDRFLGRAVRDTGGAACAEAGPRVSALSGPHRPALGGHLQSPLLGAQPAGRACEAGREGHQVAFHCGLVHCLAQLTLMFRVCFFVCETPLHIFSQFPVWSFPSLLI